ncbi:AAA family ATPase [uncultured Clostridium sp.]|uniref:AAA family ATPase n=1 Tax=uncultured Clostridium sp. TaxID=59620 RepID=UPI0025E7BED5|nr:MoxR family ATPase [uncultured Clostridium sp.]
MKPKEEISEHLLKELERFRAEYPVAEEVRRRVYQPDMPFFGKEIVEMAVSALLEGENLLLCGDKATGKNILAENLAWMFGRPVYNMSFHVNTDSGTLIGSDTFVDNEVKLRRGPVYQCAAYGGFGILDEINMAKNDAVSVLHATLDYRRIIDVPGYDRIELHPAARFIGTMNYGYAGTKELNEALVSRFMVINMPTLGQEDLIRILDAAVPGAALPALEQFSGLFLDLQVKAKNGEISTKPVDLRGMIGSLKLIRGGLTPKAAVTMGITNKCFDVFEQDMVDDIVLTRIPDSWTSSDVF